MTSTLDIDLDSEGYDDDYVATLNDEPDLPYNLRELRIPKSIIKMYKDSPYAGNLPTMTELYTNGDEEQ